MAGITLVPQFADSHGVLHPTVEAAVLAERRIMITDMVLIDHAKLGLSFAEIDATVDVLIATQPRMAEIMAVDLKRGLHNGGLIEKAGTSHFGQRLAETIQSRPATTPTATVKAKDADGAVLYIGDAVSLVSEAPADREKWGDETNRRIRAIEPDGALLFDDKQWKWAPASVRKAR